MLDPEELQPSSSDLPLIRIESKISIRNGEYTSSYEFVDQGEHMKSLVDFEIQRVGNRLKAQLERNNIFGSDRLGEGTSRSR